MALTRSYLKSLGLTEEQVAGIIEQHTETVDGLKKQIESVQKDLDNQSKLGWEAKYNDLNKQFEDYKNEQTAKAERSAKESAFRKLLVESGVSEKRIDAIMKVSDIDSIKINKDGSLHDSDKLSETVKTEWKDFITQQSTAGQNVKNPPNNTGGGMTKEDIMKITDRNARREAIKANPQAFLAK